MAGGETEARTVTLADGRVTGYAEYGDATGTPVIGFHGMPGSRLVMRTVAKAAAAAHARLIAPDRPGYGMSQPHPGGTLLGYVDDIVQLADALNIGRFAVIGVSGGGPYPSACAYMLPDRVTVAGLISAIGPLSLPHATRDMVSMNRLVFDVGHYLPGLSARLLRRLIKSSLPSMQQYVSKGASGSPDLSPESFAVMAADQAEAIRAGSEGIIFDMKILWQPWGFKFEDIRPKVYLWHGAADNLAPVALAHHIADRVPGCEAVFYPGEGHTDPLTKHIDEIIATIVAASRHA